MAIDERRRHDLYVRAEEVFGPEPANTLMELLPPVGWGDVATKRDLDVLAAATKRDLDVLAAATKRDLDVLAAATKHDLEIGLENLGNVLRAEMRADFVAQTRTMFLAIVSIVLTMAGLTFALAR